MYSEPVALGDQLVKQVKISQVNFRGGVTWSLL